MIKLFPLILFIFIPVSVQAQQLTLPKQCVEILNKNFKNWRLAKTPEDVRKWVKESKQSFQPNLIKGDWNGDKQNDYAVLIQTPKSRDGLSKTVLIAFIKNRGSYFFRQLEASEYIAIIKKGEKGYDYETDKNFVYKTDSIFTGFFEKAGVSYIWRKDKFVTVVSSD